MKVDQIVRIFCTDGKNYMGKVLSIDSRFVTLQDHRGSVFVIGHVHILNHEVVEE